MAETIKLYVPKENWNGILLVGERPNSKDFPSGIPFRSGFGLELQRQLIKVGIQLKECAATYAYKEIPPKNDIKNCYMTKTAAKKGDAVEYKGKYITHGFMDYIEVLHGEIQSLRPKCIIALGEGALFGVLGESGIDDFRGSMEYYEDGVVSIPVLPTHSPARVFKQTQLRYLVSRDLSRIDECIEQGGWPDPAWNILINPTEDEAIEKLQWLLGRLDGGEEVRLGVDIETRKRFYIGTIGFAWTDRDAVVVPFIRPNWEPYFSEATEIKVVSLCKSILEHRNVRVAGQNYHYDAQYLARHWGVRSHVWTDTMIAHHCCFTTDIPKALHVISSIYCEYHQYWKDESHGEDDDKWEPTEESWDNYLLYNGKDCCKTLDAANVLMDEVIPAMEMEKGWVFQYGMWQNLLKVMLRGNLYDWDERRKQRKELETKMKVLEDFMETVVPPELYPRHPKTAYYRSPTQLKDLFYGVLNQPVVTKKNAQKMWVPSTDDNALSVIAQREPILKPLCECISMYRSMRVFYDTFLTGVPDFDDYLRSMYKLAGTSTTRLASTGDVFDFGLNLQNLPKGDG
jgi:uracil-DNA glycosylase